MQRLNWLSGFLNGWRPLVRTARAERRARVHKRTAARYRREARKASRRALDLEEQVAQTLRRVQLLEGERDVLQLQLDLTAQQHETWIERLRADAAIEAARRTLAPIAAQRRLETDADAEY